MITTPLWVIGIGKFFKGLTLKHWLIIGGIILVLFAQWKFYNWAREGGKQDQYKDDKVIIDDLNAQLTKAKSDLEDYKTSFETWKADNEEANRRLEAENKALNETLQRQLELNKQLSQQKRKVLIREIPKYIPASVDVNLPSGFVWLYNESIKTVPALEGAGFSFSPTGDVGAPSGITLSHASETIVSNNAICLQDQYKLSLWQTWYKEARASFDEANRVKADALKDMNESHENNGKPKSTETSSQPSAESGGSG